MDPFLVVSWCLVTISAVTVLWPLNTLMVALAYRIRRGSAVVAEPEDEGGLSFWWRCTFAALGLAVLTGVLLGLMWFLIKVAGFPTGVIHLTLLLVLLPAGVWVIYWMMALDDLLEAVTVYLLYVLLPGVPLLLLGRLTHFWDTVRQSAPWLLPSS
jgi:hypothetical protein